MSEFKPITFTDEFITKFWDGTENKIVRYQSYLRRGFSLFNETKNYILLLFGSYWTIRTADYWLVLDIGDVWLILGLGFCAITGLVFLLYLGRWDLYKAQKATEFINNRHGSITGFQGFNMAVRNLEFQEEILKELKKLTKPPESGVEIAIKKL